MPESHTYGPDPEQVADLWLPDGVDRPPVVVLLHGGFWRARYGRDLMDALAADLAARGLAAWNAEYRRLDLRGGWPATCEDVAAAVDHLAELAERVDVGRVSAVGHSAGGHLALWAAGRRDPRVPLTAVVGQAAVADLEEGARLGLGDGVVARFAGPDPDWAAASPVCRAPTGVPTLLVHGTEDDTVPAALSERYAAAAGDEAELRLRPGEGHFEHIDPASGAWQDVVRWLRR